MRLKDKVAVITGAGSGIGRAMATLFAAEGARVVVADIVTDRVDETVSAIQATGGTATGIHVNVASEADIEKLLTTATATYGRIDILCNNAGIMDRMTPVGDMTDDLWERVLRINLTGPMMAMRRAIPMMIAQGGGTILNTASTAGLRGSHAGAAYTASKHGLVGLTKNTAYMYATQGIRCNAICPGGTETAIGIGGEPNAFGLERMQAGSGSMPRIGKPIDLANIALTLVSDEASFVNGSIVVVDGGWTAN